MNSNIMLKLCSNIQDRGITYDRDANLTLPNIYFCTVAIHDGRTLHTYVAGEHTAVAMEILSNWLIYHHSFRPYRSNCTIKVRRLKLGDIVENPNSYCAALKHAKEICDTDVVKALRTWPRMIANMVGVELPLDTAAAVDAWDKLSAEVSAMGLRA